MYYSSTLLKLMHKKQILETFINHICTSLPQIFSKIRTQTRQNRNTSTENFFSLHQLHLNFQVISDKLN